MDDSTHDAIPSPPDPPPPRWRWETVASYLCLLALCFALPAIPRRFGQETIAHWYVPTWAFGIVLGVSGARQGSWPNSFASGISVILHILIPIMALPAL